MLDTPEHTANLAEDMPFDLRDLFYSRTDKRGVILAGNAVFQRISGYEWPQLIGAPHRIMRSPDMPRCVFRIMWRALQRDEPVVAYVRNRTLDGRGYWVIATIFPMAGGYLSVRVKPTCAIFHQMKGIFTALAEAERHDGLSMDDSEARLLAEINKLGFPDYRAFSTYTIGQAFRARALTLSPRLKGYFADIDRIESCLKTTIQYQADLLTSVAMLRDLPTNMRIIASRLEPSGGPLSAMSDIYSATSATLFAEIAEFALGKDSITKLMTQSFEKACFAKTCALLQTEVLAGTVKENLQDAGFDAAQEVEALQTLKTQLELQEKLALKAAEQLSDELNRASYDLRRSMLGLDTIRVMGLVESGRLGNDGSRIGATMQQIGTCHDSIIRLLQKIKDNATMINSGVMGIRLQFAHRPGLAAG